MLKRSKRGYKYSICLLIINKLGVTVIIFVGNG